MLNGLFIIEAKTVSLTEKQVVPEVFEAMQIQKAVKKSIECRDDEAEEGKEESNEKSDEDPDEEEEVAEEMNEEEDAYDIDGSGHTHTIHYQK